MYVNFHSGPQLNPDVNVFQRKFVNEVRRCEEMDRKLSKSTLSLIDTQDPKTDLFIKFHPVISPVQVLVIAGRPHTECQITCYATTSGQHPINCFPFLLKTGFVEKEIKRAHIGVIDTGENPEVPFPRDMIDLEVTALNRPLQHPSRHDEAHPQLL